jgi:hypothetical protein
MRTAIDGWGSTERQTLAHTIDQQIEHLTAYVHAHGEPLRPQDIFRPTVRIPLLASHGRWSRLVRRWSARRMLIASKPN